MKVLIGENENIIVTVWFENYQSFWGQNMINQNVQGTLWRCLWKYHPDIIYTEADLSHYNKLAYTFEDIASKLGVDVPELYHGPTIMVMRDESGRSFRTHDDPEKLIKVVDEYIRTWEKSLFNIKNPPWDIKEQYLADNHYEHYMPFGDLQMYDPDTKQQKSTKNVNVREAPPSSLAPEPSPLPTSSSSSSSSSSGSSSSSSSGKFSLSEPSKAFSR